MSALTSRWRRTLIAVAVAAAYVGAARLGLSLAFERAPITLVWPPSGVALAAVLLWGQSVVPGLMIGALLANLSTGSPVPFAMASAIGNPLEAVLAAHLLRRMGFEMSLERVADVALLAGCAAIAAVPAATIGVSALWALGLAHASVGRLLAGWWIGDGLGILICAPALLAAARPVMLRRIRHRAEHLIAFALLIIAAYAVFATHLLGGFSYLPLPYFLLPLLMWIAIRFGPGYTALATLIVSTIAVVGTSADLGFFNYGELQQRLSMLVSYLLLISLTSMVLAAVSLERDSAARRAWHLNEELEQRVRQRTEELATAHDQLLDRSVGLESANRTLERQTSAMRAQQLAALNLAEDAQQAHQMAVKAERALAIQAEELRLARDTAQAATRIKSNFLATMSHEIRTPMNGIIGMTDLLLESPLSADQREQLVTVQRSGHALLAIINDILDFSKVEAGKLVVEPLPTDIRAVIDDVLQLLRPRALEKGLELSVEYTPGLPDVIETDPGRVRQVLTNLVGNAIKFTGAGCVRIHVEMQAGGMRLRFRVADSGPGIPVQSQKDLFQPFSQLDVSTTRRFGGTGLGLAICRQLIDLLGGEIGVVSPAPERPAVGGPGSVFWFSLPATVSTRAVRSAGRAAPVTPIHEKGSPSSLCRVLVAEDNPVNQMVIRAMLRKLGVEPTLVADGRQAVDAVAGQSFDMVLMDCQMPVMDGFEATRMIRGASGSLPVIVAVTANAMAGDSELCRAAGMDDYISKPISVRELRRVLAPWIDEASAPATSVIVPTSDNTHAA